MEYGRTEPYFSTVEGGIEARGGPIRLTCTSSVNLSCGDSMARAVFSVAAGEAVEMKLAYTPSFPRAAAQPEMREPSIEDTLAAWESWSAQHTGYDGASPAQVRRSSLVLQGLTYQPSGAILAAATTSLPETMGGGLNFDYRYAWLRDLSLTIRSLWIAACPHEPSRLFEWLAFSAGHVGDELVQIMYGVEGERDLTEHILEHLAGYRGSSPVRVGNEAWGQLQLDVFGEVLDAAHLLQDKLGKFESATQEMLVALANRAANAWREPDAGMWEARDKQRQYVSSKVMCWVALDRAVCLAPNLGATRRLDDWQRARDDVRAAVLEQGWSAKAGAYTGAFGSDDLDASVLLLPIVGFLSASDERMRATIDAVERELGEGGLVRRWPSDPSGFLICTYWLVECLALAGEHERAHDWFSRATGHANDLGLLSEEADPMTGELLGNYPQAFSHVGLINAAWRLGQATATES
jgi:GH15 family glucan-1,4-alpha-glucosidase